MKKTSSKKVPKKKLKKSSPNSRKKAINIIKRRQMLNFGLTVILGILVIFTVTLIYLNTVEIQSGNPFIEKLSEFNNRIFPKPQNLAATVNKEPITLEEVDKVYEQLPLELLQVTSKEDVLSEMIDEIILMQEARELEITVSDDEVDVLINDLLLQNQITIEDFEDFLLSRGLSLKEAKEFYIKSIMINKLLNENVFIPIQISDTDIKDYYFKNIDRVTIPQSVNVSHIILCHEESTGCFSNITKQEADIKIKWVRTQVNDTNFADLALKFSDEPSAQINFGNLGWISRQDYFDPVFLNATFELEEGELSRPVETVFGYHLIKVHEKKESETIDLEIVYDQINQTLIQEQQQEQYFHYIESKRNQSEIIYFKI